MSCVSLNTEEDEDALQSTSKDLEARQPPQTTSEDLEAGVEEGLCRGRRGRRRRRSLSRAPQTTSEDLEAGVEEGPRGEATAADDKRGPRGMCQRRSLRKAP